MSGFDHEECPHCDEPQPPQQMDAHVASAHTDLAPCTARIENEHRETYRCAFRVGHAKGEYGKWHASTRSKSPGRYVWNDSALGATPHRDPEPRIVGLDHFKAMGAVSHTVVATGGQQSEPEVDENGTDEGRPEPPSEDDMNDALPVRPDPRQAAYDAVYDYIRRLGDYQPPDRVHRNAIIWRAVHAALGATPVGRCISSHCVEGDHMVPVEEAP